MQLLSCLCTKLRLWLALLTFVISSLLCFNLSAQSQEMVVDEEEEDYSYHFMSPSSDVIVDYQNDPRFRYFKGKDVKLEEPKEEEQRRDLDLSFMGQVLRVIASVILSPIFRIFSVIIVVGLLLYFIFKKLNMNMFTSLGKKNKEVKADTDTINEDEIYLNDFDRLTAQALERGDYRLAVRILFLKNLDALNTRGIIVWDKKKTNRFYATQIEDATLRKIYNQHARIFDYIWYGEFEVAGEEFEVIRDLYNDLYNTVMHNGKN